MRGNPEGLQEESAQGASTTDLHYPAPCLFKNIVRAARGSVTTVFTWGDRFFRQCQYPHRAEVLTMGIHPSIGSEEGNSFHLMRQLCLFRVPKLLEDSLHRPASRWWSQ